MKITSTNTVSLVVALFLSHCRSSCYAWISASFQRDAPVSRMSLSATVEHSTLATTNDADDDDDVLTRERRQRILLRRFTEQAMSGYRPESALNAVRVLHELQELHELNGLNAEKETDDFWIPLKTYNAVLQSLKLYAAEDVRRNWNEAVEAAQKVLESMPEPSVISYTTYMNLVGLRGQLAAAKQVAKLWHELPVERCGRTYNAVLQAWTTAHEPEQADQLLQQWEQDDNHVQRLGAASYAIVISGYNKKTCRGNPDERFDAVANVWERMWKRVECGHSTDTITTCRPGTYSLTSFLAACHKMPSYKSAKLAQEALFKTYQFSTPSLANEHNASIANSPQGGQKEYRSINAKIVTIVLDCWKRSGDREAGPRAKALVEWMVNEFKTTGSEALRPNCYTFSTAIGAWARSRQFDKAAKAQAMLQWMQQLHEEGIVPDPPNSYCYTGVIQCCAYPEREPSQQKQALDICIATYKEMKAQQSSTGAASPTPITYGAVLNALGHLVPLDNPQRAAAISSVLGDAINRGLVGDTVIRHLQLAVPADEIQSILRAASVAVGSSRESFCLQDIPAHWRRNVISQGFRPRQQ